ncbi:MAG: hypothetical protein GSR80_001805 [Desulfurococcales archaeon]|nr:hypothetical protein [Desulfurococcales archaeon]
MLRQYEAGEIINAAERVGAKAFEDPLYGASIPVISREELVLTCDPIESMKYIISRPTGQLEFMLVHIASLLGAAGVGIGALGVTGTLAMGVHVEGISDIDLVVYGPRASLEVYEAFASIGEEPPGARRGIVNGVKVHPPLSLAWRRRVVDGTHVSWTGAPEAAASHCAPLREWRRLEPPRGRARLALRVPGGQVGALLYPPCVESEEGVHIVSFEYNLGALLYEGGLMEVEGLASEEAILLGTREYPGSLRLLGGR